MAGTRRRFSFEALALVVSGRMGYQTHLCSFAQGFLMLQFAELPVIWRHCTTEPRLLAMRDKPKARTFDDTVAVASTS